MRISAQVANGDMKRVQKALGQLPDKLQKKVLTQALHRTQDEVVKPMVASNINARAFEPPAWNAELGVPPAMKSHSFPPGALKRAMMSKGPKGAKRVRAIKRSRVQVGRVIVTPTRDELGIPDAGVYSYYYPAALEFMKSPIGNAQRPFLRGTYSQNKSMIAREFANIARSRIRKVWPKK